ncbi:MAG: EAL domain-containing protein [Pseudomonadota bacterium]
MRRSVKLTPTQTFYGLFALGCALATGIACALVWISTRSAFQTFTIDSVALEARGSAESFASYVSDRQRTLDALAGDRILVATGMGGFDAKRVLDEKLSQFNLFDDQRRVMLYSLTLEPVVDHPDPRLADVETSAAILKEAAARVIESGSVTPLVTKKMIAGQPTIVIAEPILFRGEVEAVLVGGFEFIKGAMGAGFDSDAPAFVEVTSSVPGHRSLTPPASFESRWLQISTPIAGTALTHHYFRNINALSSSQERALWKTAAALALGLVIAFGALLAMGRRLMLNPYMALEASREALEDTNKALEHNALHDALTGLPNRRYLDAHLAAMTEKCRVTGKGFTILHIDLDRFKEINDTLGHAAGDTVLRHVGEELRASVRDEDFVARIGGDEFVMVVGTADERDAIAARAEALVEKMRRPVPFEEHLCRFGASVGIASAQGRRCDGKKLLIDADIALYRAKAQGRNGYAFYSEEDEAGVAQRKSIADGLRRGLEEGEFVPFYQPQICARTKRVVGVEALARWRDPERGLLTPDHFLPVAEDLGVVAEIDAQILAIALDDMNAIEAQGLPRPRVSVNVSSRRLRDAELAQKIRELPIAPGQVSFELLESIFLEEDDAVRFAIDALRESGIDIEIDDFGTGHASVMSLVRLSPDRLKIDRRFVQPMLDTEPARRLVKAMIEIGDALGVEVVAEGVETDAHIAALSALDCDILQGYGIARPMPVSGLEAWLRAREEVARAS